VLCPSLAGPVIAGNATPDQIQAFQRARDDFRSQAAYDSLYLAIVGLGVFTMTYMFMLIVRPDYVIPSLLSAGRLIMVFFEVDMDRREEFEENSRVVP